MIETTDEAVTYLEMVARRESGDLAEAALIVTRTLRQATQTLADHAQAAEAAEAEVAALRAEALRHAGECARHAADDRAVIADLRAERDDLKRKGELLCQAYGEHLIEHGSGGRCGAERDAKAKECLEWSERSGHFMRKYDEARAERDRLRASITAALEDLPDEPHDAQGILERALASGESHE